MAGKKVKQSLRYSFWDGVFASIQFGIIEQFWTPLALFMGADNVAIGFLNFVRNSLVSMVQVLSADVTRRLQSRKKILTACVLTASLLWLPTFFAPFFFPQLKIWIFIALFGVTSAFNLFATPAWASLMAEYIPFRKRGAYFGWRGMVLGMVYCLGMLLAGLILQWFYNISLFIGFLILIFIAAVSRFISWYFLTKMYEPPWRQKTVDYFSFKDFLGRFPAGNFVRFSMLSCFFLLSISLSSAFIPVYLLKGLGADYLTFTFLLGAAVFTTYLTQGYWGKHADNYGNMKIIKLCVLFIAFIPFLWILSGNFYYLFVVQLFAGFVWAGFNLSTSNFIYDVAISSKRERCIAYYNFLSGLGLGVGAMMGGVLLLYLPAFAGSIYLSLFLVSGVFRFVFAGTIVVFSKEVRAVQPVRVRTVLMDLSGMRSIGLLSRELLFRSKAK